MANSYSLQAYLSIEPRQDILQIIYSASALVVNICYENQILLLFVVQA